MPTQWGGSKSEDQWRDEFGAASLGVSEPPVSHVEVGIDRVYGTVKRNELFVFKDLAPLLDELGSHSRVLDDLGEPTGAWSARVPRNPTPILRISQTRTKMKWTFGPWKFPF